MNNPFELVMDVPITRWEAIQEELALLHEENRRMRIALETINQIATDMLDPDRRAGPALRGVRQDESADADAAEETTNSERENLGLRGL